MNLEGGQERQKCRQESSRLQPKEGLWVPCEEGRLLAFCKLLQQLWDLGSESKRKDRAPTGVLCTLSEVQQWEPGAISRVTES